MTDQELESLAKERHDEDVRRLCLATALNSVRGDERDFLTTVLTRALAFHGFITNTVPKERVLH